MTDESISAVAILTGLGLLFGVILAIAYRKFRVEEDPRIDRVEDLLPGANCGACGEPGCRAFAENVVDGLINPAKCTVSSSDEIDSIATYLGIDMAPENVNKASETGYPGEPNFTCADLFDLQPDSSYDLLISSAFLDLVSLDSALPHLIRILKPGGLAYFPINFDGLTYFEPVHPADAHVLDAYHASMDDRPGGGHSQTGRRLFRALPAAGFEILSVGASDWMVFPSSGSYPGEEAYFLRHILHFFEKSCAGAPGLAGWLADRKAQIGRGELVYIAHQYDFLAQRRF